VQNALSQTRTTARAVVSLHSTTRWRCRAARDRPTRRAAPMTPVLFDECGHTALVPYYRPHRRLPDAIKGWPEILIRADAQSRAGRLGGGTLEAAVRSTG